MKITVLGIGQSLRGDDGAGIEAVRQWKESYPDTASRIEVRVETNELPGLTLIDFINKNDVLILVDATQSSAKVGTVHCVEPENFSAFTSDSQSAHGWGAAETIQLARQLNPALKNYPIKLIGIEVGQTIMGSGLSKTVRNAIPLACCAIQAEIEKFLGA